jgi:hypothetical protein
MSKNLAELIPINIDPSIKTEWDLLVDNNRSLEWDWRTFVGENVLGLYFKSLVDDIVKTINIEPKNILVQVFDPSLYNEKEYLKIVHRDVDRLSCITIPLKFHVMEPIMFYEDIPGLGYEQIKKEKRTWPEKPSQIANYSQNHPTLVNVNRLHNVRLLDLTSPRILFQLSFDESFDEIIHKNPDIWRII